ncbi:MAG: DciA family protein, partial [Nesterenkonia sp.]|nr:DciA family protein [Nesterenkonia sp.]
LGPVVDRLIAHRGWTAPVAVGSVVARWDQLVGPQVAEHCRPERFEDGVVDVVCDTTAWATNLKLMQPQLMDVFTRELGRGIVTGLRIRGPQAPSWKKGRLSVRGRGPRDTYG